MKLREGLERLGFEVERSKKKGDKILRPVFFGEGGVPTQRFEIDAYHQQWRCGLEVEATRTMRGGAFYRDLIQALVMVDVEQLCIAVPNDVVFGKAGKSKAYDECRRAAEAL